MKGKSGLRKEILRSGSTLKFKLEIFIIDLWINEFERVFLDKNTYNKEKYQVKNYIHEISLENLN